MAASYDSAGAITAGINDMVAAGTLSAATAAAVAGIVSSLTPAQVADAFQTESITPMTASEIISPVVIMAEGTSVNADFGANSPVKSIILNETTEASNITFATNDDVMVVLGGAQGDSVVTAGGNDSITFNGGSADISTGTGDDVIIIQPDASGSATVDAGTGFDALQMSDHRSGHTFTSMGHGRFQMHSDVAVTMDNVNVVQFMDGNLIDEITVLATTKGEALVAMLYEVALGREAIDANGGNIDGLKFWMDTFDGGRGSEADASLIVDAFTACQEFVDKTGALDNQQFVAHLMNNIAAGTTTVAGQDAAYYASQLDRGAMDRSDVVETFATSTEASNAFGAQGDAYVIEGFTA